MCKGDCFWDDGQCVDSKFWIKLLDIDQDTFDSLGPCPDEWSYFSGTKSCYKVVEESKSWDEARTACLELDADLASITNEETNIFLSTLTNKSSFIGGYKDTNNNWKWSDGSTWGYTNWCSGQPDGSAMYTLFNCAWLNERGVGKWDDGGSAPSLICQINIFGK